MKKRLLGFLIAIPVAIGVVAAAVWSRLGRVTPHETATHSLYDLDVRTLDGKPAPLAAYRGKVALVVNVASRCGFTPQYEGLEKLYTDLAARGFVVLAFPCNDFGGQEPGTPEQIHEFCSSQYRVTFPMFQKVQVKPGAGQSPVYDFLTAGGQAPAWNFGKYLIDRQGHVVKFFGTRTTPDARELRQAIEAQLQSR
jgi:glutathione peroxidase